MPRHEVNPYPHDLFLTPMVSDCWHPPCVPPLLLAVPLRHGGTVYSILMLAAGALAAAEILRWHT